MKPNSPHYAAFFASILFVLFALLIRLAVFCGMVALAVWIGMKIIGTL